MAANDDIQAFVQSVYSRVKNRFYDEITSSDGQTFVRLVVDFANGFIDELENQVDTEGMPVNWDWVYDPAHPLGSAAVGDTSITLPGDINNLLTGENRYVQILQGSTVISTWAVVQPGQISNRSGVVNDDMCARVGDTLLFSRAFNDEEDGGDIVGDVTLPIPRMVIDFTTPANSNADVLSVVQPRELLVLGVAKNQTLPDIVQGVLSPSYVQKFNDLLAGALARNTISSKADTVERDDLSDVRGVGL